MPPRKSIKYRPTIPVRYTNGRYTQTNVNPAPANRVSAKPTGGPKPKKNIFRGKGRVKFPTKKYKVNLNLNSGKNLVPSRLTLGKFLNGVSVVLSIGLSILILAIVVRIFIAGLTPRNCYMVGDIKLSKMKKSDGEIYYERKFDHEDNKNSELDDMKYVLTYDSFRQRWLLVVTRMTRKVAPAPFTGGSVQPEPDYYKIIRYYLSETLTADSEKPPLSRYALQTTEEAAQLGHVENANNKYMFTTPHGIGAGYPATC